MPPPVGIRPDWPPAVSMAQSGDSAEAGVRGPPEGSRYGQPRRTPEEVVLMVARMNDAEAIMWAVESDPFLRSDFMNITLLDQAPDRGRLRSGIEQAIGLYPPLRQRVVRPPLGLAPPVWADDPDFDLDYH